MQKDKLLIYLKSKGDIVINCAVNIYFNEIGPILNIGPKKLRKATVPILSRAQDLSVTPFRPQVMEARATRSGRLSKPPSSLQDYA